MCSLLLRQIKYMPTLRHPHLSRIQLHLSPSPTSINYLEITTYNEMFFPKNGGYAPSLNWYKVQTIGGEILYPSAGVAGDM